MEEDPGQLSLFEVLSSQVVDAGRSRSAFDDDDDDDDDEGGADPDAGGPEEDVPVELPSLPTPGTGRYGVGLPPELADRPLAEVKVELRSANADLAKELARCTGLSHREVNGRLNRLVSVERVADATVDQLRRRAAQAEQWMASL